MSEPLEAATVWLRHAHEDLAVAQREHERDDAVHRWVCFAAQQAAEKGLKAICVYEDIDFPFTHNIERLRRLLPDRWAITESDVRLATLTPWAVAGRYPADAPDATAKDAKEALNIATTVLRLVDADFHQLAAASDDNDSEESEDDEPHVANSERVGPGTSGHSLQGDSS